MKDTLLYEIFNDESIKDLLKEDSEARIDALEFISQLQTMLKEQSGDNNQFNTDALILLCRICMRLFNMHSAMSLALLKISSDGFPEDFNYLKEQIKGLL